MFWRLFYMPLHENQHVFKAEVLQKQPFVAAEYFVIEF